MATVKLTPKEEEVLMFLADGMSYTEIGSELHISNHTVKSHVRSLKDKLRASNSNHIISMAYHNGLLIPRIRVNGSMS